MGNWTAGATVGLPNRAVWAKFPPLDEPAVEPTVALRSFFNRLLTHDAENMQSNENSVFFESSVRYYPNRIRAAAVYCSDGRFGDQVDELMHTALKLPRYDRLAVPGGAACLASHFETYREEEGVVEQLRFLFQVHSIERVVLIAHEGCAFYLQRLHVSPLQLQSQQHDDIKK